MSGLSPVPATTGSLHVPGARLHYESRGDGDPIVLVGAPMDADAFAPLADLLASDHTVLTTDPRGIKRSPVEDPDEDSTPEMRADDLSRLLHHLDVGPVAVFGSSGGAVTALALVQAHPEQVRAVVAHEPPLEELLPDREQRRLATDAIVATYLSDGPGAAWARFLADAGLDLSEGEGPAALPSDPAERDPREVADERHFFLSQLRATTHWQPDLTALRVAASRIVVGIGERSAGQVCDLTSTALAAELEIRPARFPGGHTGFLEDTEAFAARLREVLGYR